ncbi:hypothetical protein F4604DRAFT_1565083, partial [Suillus subluteus]
TNLPGGHWATTRWSSVFIPTLILTIGDRDEVWSIPEMTLRDILQDIWNVVYGDITHTVTTNGPVIAIALQRLSDWRHNIGHSAVSVLASFMLSQDDVETDRDREDFANSLLFKLGFLYGHITEDGKFQKPFQSDLILEVLVQHSHSTSGAINRHRSPTDITHARGAIGLITLERALKIIGHHPTLGVNSKGKAVKVPHTLNKATGKDSGSRSAFSVTNFGSATRNYMKSINRLEESIVQELWGCVKALTVTRGRNATVVLDNADSDDERALIFWWVSFFFFLSFWSQLTIFGTIICRLLLNVLLLLPARGLVYY